MPARRITIVGLITVLFGMVFAILVADASRQKRPRAPLSFTTCLFEATPHCAASQN